MIGEEDQVPAVAQFFSRRAKMVAKVSPEDFKEFLNKTQRKSTTVTSSENIVSTPDKKGSQKLPRTKTQKNAVPVLEEIVNDDNVETEPISPDITLSASAKRRLKKLQVEEDLELKRMEDENEKIFSAIKSSEYNEVEEVPEDNFDKVNVLTISYLSEVSRLKCYDCDKFSTIFPKVAELFNLKVSEFLLSCREQVIKVDDTPKSLNITDSDILECIPYQGGKSYDAESEYNANTLKIIFQTSDSKRKIDMSVHKLEKMQDIMEKYSKLRGIALKLLTFEFDGERISGTETPEDLDMESGNCIDVTVLTLDEEKVEELEVEELEVEEVEVGKTKGGKKRGRKPKGSKKRGRKSKAAETILNIDSDSDTSDILYINGY